MSLLLHRGFTSTRPFFFWISMPQSLLLFLPFTFLLLTEQDTFTPTLASELILRTSFDFLPTCSFLVFASALTFSEAFGVTSG